MFSKKKCGRCNAKVGDSFDFCPSCGLRLKNSGEDWGMLGKNDFVNNSEIGLPPGLGGLFNTLVKQLSKEMEREMRKGAKKQPNKKPSKGISIRISTMKNGAPEIDIKSFGQPQKVEEVKPMTEIVSKEMKRSNKSFKGLPREEPKTDIRRFSDRVVYEIEIPGVESVDDISINKLENSIEIKAIAKDKVYTKNVPFSLPIVNYQLENGKLVLELDDSE